jgi:hypothetical protein
LPGWVAVLSAIVLLLAAAVLLREPAKKPLPIAITAPSTSAGSSGSSAQPGQSTPAPVARYPDQDPVFSLPPTRTIADVRLPSASPDFQFSFSAVVHWSAVLSGSRHGDLGSVAVDALLARAKVLTAGQRPTEEALNQHRLAALLGEPDLDERGQVRTWATEVRLRLPDADSKHLQVLAALHRREQTTLLERRMERDQRAYLTDDVLATPGSAAVWWLVNNPGQVEEAVNLLGTLSQLSAVANDLDTTADSNLDTTADKAPGTTADKSLERGHEAAGRDPRLAVTSATELAALLSSASQPPPVEFTSKTSPPSEPANPETSNPSTRAAETSTSADQTASASGETDSPSADDPPAVTRETSGEPDRQPGNGKPRPDAADNRNGRYREKFVSE